MKKGPFVYLDGRFFVVSHLGFDSVCLPGRGVFETMRSYDGHVFALGRHLERLIGSCAVLGFRCPSKDGLAHAVRKLLVKNRLKNTRIRLAIFLKKKRICVFASCLKLPSRHGRREGFRAAIILKPRIKISARNKIKSLQRDFYDRLYRLAQERGCDEAIFLNGRGNIVEGTRTNVFMVRNGILYTPKLSCGCLDGITRALVIELANALAVVVREGRMGPAFLRGAEEIFLTNSVRGIMPVAQLDGKAVGPVAPGEITTRLMKRYKILIEKECKRR